MHSAGGNGMALFDFFDIAALEGRERSVTSRRLMRFTTSTSALALGSLLAVVPASSLLAASPAGGYVQVRSRPPDRQGYRCRAAIAHRWDLHRSGLQRGHVRC